MRVPPRPRFPRAAILAAVLSLAGGTAVADVLGDEGPLDFALHLTHLKTSLHAPGRDDTATVNQIAMSFFDTRLPAVQPGLYLGYVWIDLAEGPAAALAPEGYLIGFAVRGPLLHRPRFELTATGSYLYQRAEDSNDTRSVTLEWFQPQLDLDALWRIAPSFGVRLGATYGRADVDQRSSGVLNQGVTLSSDAVFGGRAGVELDLGGDGQIGFMLHQAVGEGVELYFQRQF